MKLGTYDRQSKFDLVAMTFNVCFCAGHAWNNCRLTWNNSMKSYLGQQLSTQSCIKIREAKAQHIRLLKLSIRHQISSQPKLTRSLPALTPGFYYRRVLPQWLLLGYSSLQPNSNRTPCLISPYRTTKNTYG